MGSTSFLSKRHQANGKKLQTSNATHRLPMILLSAIALIVIFSATTFMCRQPVTKLEPKPEVAHLLDAHPRDTHHDLTNAQAEQPVTEEIPLLMQRSPHVRASAEPEDL